MRGISTALSKALNVLRNYKRGISAKLQATFKIKLPAVPTGGNQIYTTTIKLHNYLFRLLSKFNAYPVAERSKVWICGCLFAGITGSNPARGMDVCLL